MRYIMCRTRGLLAVVALCLGLAHSFSWDYALITKHQIDYYLDSKITDSKKINPGLPKSIHNIIYDSVSERMFFLDYGQKILSYDIKTNKFETVVLSNDTTNQNVHSIAYDHVEQKLFWLDSMGKTIKWVSMKPGANNDHGGNVFATLDIRKPIAIAVDSCNGYIYLTGTEYDGENNRFKSSIQRIRLEGGNSEVVVPDIRIPLENSLVVVTV